ncbi:hypothetical protein [Caballeronia sp. TF1N1]|uniref:hypothetical protein n=1 Tax=Caballeronia sp. TF1N1 TaxID=2878153 RepID=UPI001FD0AFAA|nr:hypothetical protein [Caballeronia sp. TF1N1]
MNSISKIIIGKPTLPNKFVSEDYDRFLFYDFFLRAEPAFFIELQNAVLHRQGIDGYCANTLKPLMKISQAENRAEKIKILDDELVDAGNPFGFIVFSDEGRWVMAQDIPVNWGILAFRSNDTEMVSVFDAIKKDWFLSLDDFAKAQHNSCSVFHEVFDRDFISKIIRNYGVSAK